MVCMVFVCMVFVCMCMVWYASVSYKICGFFSVCVYISMYVCMYVCIGPEEGITFQGCSSPTQNAFFK